MAPEASRFFVLRVIAFTLLRFSIANLAGAAAVFVYLTVLSPGGEGEPASREDIVASLAAFGSFIAVVLPVGYITGLRHLEPAVRWIQEGRAPTAFEREETLRTPWKFVLAALTYWSVAPLVFGPLNLVVLDNPPAIVVRNTIGTLLGGLATSALAYLLVERSLRPVFAMALRGETPGRERFLGIRPRLLVSWALGSGIPFLGIAMAVVRTDDVAVARPVVFLAGIGLVGGWLVMLAAADSVARPLDRMRDAVRQVEQGELRVEVDVDDGGEVGLLQSGFNRMVAGLRERQRLRDLFGRHVGVEVAKQALEETGLGGEQREASTLFVDLVGSTALAQQLPPAEVVRMLNALFDAVVQAVGAEGGWVNKFEGDGALCVFGAPVDQPDHASRALRAARALRMRLVCLGEQYPPLDAGIGVSSGTVVAGNVGAEERYEYTVIGDPVNEAARLTELAKGRPGRVLAAEASLRVAGAPEAGEWAEAGTFELRGRSTPTRAYEPRSTLQV